MNDLVVYAVEVLHLLQQRLHLHSQLATQGLLTLQLHKDAFPLLGLIQLPVPTNLMQFLHPESLHLHILVLQVTDQQFNLPDLSLQLENRITSIGQGFQFLSQQFLAILQFSKFKQVSL